MSKTRLAKLIAIGLAALLGTGLLIHGLSTPTVEAGVEPTAGIEAIATPRACDFISIEGVTYAFCDDGYKGAVRPFGDGESTE